MKINTTFGRYDKFVEELKNADTTQFGNNWARFVLEGNDLKVAMPPCRYAACSRLESAFNHRRPD